MSTECRRFESRPQRSASAVNQDQFTAHFSRYDGNVVDEELGIRDSPRLPFAGVVSIQEMKRIMCNNILTYERWQSSVNVVSLRKIINRAAHQASLRLREL